MTTNFVARPQEPQPPFPYLVEEVTFQNTTDNVTLAGTFTKPNTPNKHPAIILIAGMGPKDRDATMAGHKPLFVLADYFTRAGIAVLRYDKRGVGSSTGTFSLDVTSNDLAHDVAAAVAYLQKRPDVDATKIGLLGWSEGGLIAPLVATTTPSIAFVVLMAGVIETSTEAFIEQTLAQLKADGASSALQKKEAIIRKKLYDIIMQEPDTVRAKEKLTQAMTEYFLHQPQELKTESQHLHFAFTPEKVSHSIAMLNSPWYRFLFNAKPQETLAQLKVPLLAVCGTHDFIVMAKRSLPLIAKICKEAGNINCTTVELAGLNHQLQTCATGALHEYAATEETIALQALNVMSDWIVKKTLS